MVGRAAAWTAMAVLLTSGTISIANYCAAALSSYHFRLLLTVLIIAAIVMISCSLHHDDRYEEEQQPHHHHHHVVRKLTRRLSREIWSHLPAAFHAEPQEVWRDIAVDSGNAEPQDDVLHDIPVDSGNGGDVPWPTAPPPPPPHVAEEEKSMDATWKAITDAKKVMEKSWTWERRHRPELERKAAMRGAPRRRRHEIVMEKDELFRQVDAFIKNHYLQRQESEKRRRLANNSNLNGHDFLHQNYYHPHPIPAV